MPSPWNHSFNFMNIIPKARTTCLPHISCFSLTIYSFILGAPSLNCSLWDLWSLLQHAGSLAVARELGWDMWGRVPLPGMEPGPPALGALSLGHWTIREVLSHKLFKVLMMWIWECSCMRAYFKFICLWIPQLVPSKGKESFIFGDLLQERASCKWC